MLSHIISKKYKNVNVCNKFYYFIIVPYHLLIFNIFFLFLNFLSPYYLKNKTKQNKTKTKTFLLPVSPQLLLNFFQLFLSHFASLSPYYSLLAITHSSSFLLSYILTFLLTILFCINLISFPSFNLYFSHTKNVSTLSR